MEQSIVCSICKSHDHSTQKCRCWCKGDHTVMEHTSENSRYCILCDEIGHIQTDSGRDGTHANHNPARLFDFLRTRASVTYKENEKQLIIRPNNYFDLGWAKDIYTRPSLQSITDKGWDNVTVRDLPRNGTIVLLGWRVDDSTDRFCLDWMKQQYGDQFIDGCYYGNN